MNVKVQVFSLIPNLKTYHPTFTIHPLITGRSVHSCAISTPCRAYSPAAVSAQSTYRTPCHLCSTKSSFSPETSEAFEGEVPCPKTQHLTHDISLKILHQAGFENARQVAVSAECHAPTIAPCPSLHSCWRRIPVKVF